MQLSVIIPVLNEEATIAAILSKVIGLKDIYEVIVVDDGSTDKTLEILQKLKKSAKFAKKLKIFSHKRNLGKGSAIRTGIKRAKGNFVIIQDADLEYDPREFSKLTKIAKEDGVVYGSRIMGKSKHAYFRTYLGNIAITTLCNVLFGSRLTDSYTCYKLIPSKIFKSLNLKSHGFEIEAEITAKLLKKRIEIHEVAINYKPRSYEKGKKIKAKDAITGALKLIEIRANRRV
jgi:glycosyltransferase involved in cell wall biosynthesis